MTCRLFVYGSLQRAERNHFVLQGARFVGEARTAPGFALFDLGSFPAMTAHGKGQVEGELFEVDQALLERVDRFEDHPRFYDRTTIHLDDGTTAEAYLMAYVRLRASRRFAGTRWRSKSKGSTP